MVFLKAVFSVLLFFIMYTTPLSTLISSLSLYHHLYANDTQRFLSFHPSDFQTSITRLHNALTQITSWMTSKLLSLNSSKTEFLLIQRCNLWVWRRNEKRTNFRASNWLFAQTTHAEVAPWNFAFVVMSPLNHDDKPHDFNLNLVTWSWDAALKNFYHIYTDGSKMGHRVSAALCHKRGTSSIRPPGATRILDAKLHAILLALDIVRRYKEKHSLLLSDSYSSPIALEEVMLTTIQFINILTYSTLTHSGKTIILCWIPGHIWIPGNESC